MGERILVLIAALLAFLLAGVGLFWQPEIPERPLPKARMAAGGDFTLNSAKGPVSLTDFRGKLVLVYFGYTYCPDICPTSLAATAGGLKLLTPDEAALVSMIFISVDPKRDTPSRLAEYAQFFDPAIIGVSGDMAVISDVARRYGAYFAEQKVDTAGGYVVDHSSDTFVVAQDGSLVGKIAHGTPPAEVVATIRKYLKKP